MADNARYQNSTYATLPTGLEVETNQQIDGSHRQVVSVGDSALPTGAATADNQTSGAAKTQIVLSDGTTEVDIWHPFKVDGDSVYHVDVAEPYCTKVGWTGDYSSLFDCPNSATEMYNDTVKNPKVLYIAFCRTLYCNAVGLGCNTGKTFSNAKLEFIGSDGTVRYTYNDSTNNTKYGTRLYSFAPTACIAIRFSFFDSRHGWAYQYHDPERSQCYIAPAGNETRRDSYRR